MRGRVGGAGVRALEATEGYGYRMTERVAELLERVQQLSGEEREELDQAFVAWREREGDESEPLGNEAGDEAVRRLRALQQGGPKGRPVGEYFDDLEARARAKSA